MFKTIYHVTNGPAVMYEIDARHALANFPEQWTETEVEPKPQFEKPGGNKAH